MQSIANNPALRSQFETQVNYMTELTHSAYDAARKLSELNLHLAQRLLEDSVETSRQMLGCANPFQAAAVAMRQAAPVAQHWRTYQHELIGLMAGAQADLSRATGAHLPLAGRSAAAVADEFPHRTQEARQAFADQQAGQADAWAAPGSTRH